MSNTDKKAVKRDDLIYPELCYQIIGILFSVYNELGYGHKEIIYQNAISNLLKNTGLNFKTQVYAPVIFGYNIIGKNFFDFLIDNKMVLEIKKGNYFHKSHIDQVYRYLISNNLKLGLLVYFTSKNLHFKRIVNLK